jgi:hypothetical protein
MNNVETQCGMIIPNVDILNFEYRLEKNCPECWGKIK